MAITDTVTKIKAYFCDWHTKHYKVLHETPLDTISNQATDDNKLVSNKAVRNAINGVAVDVANTIVPVNNKNRTIQTTLNDFDSRLTALEDNTVRKNDIASFQETTPLFNSYISGERGFSPQIDETKSKNGLITWQEKLDLTYLKQWRKFSGNNLGTGENAGLTLHVNPVLRLASLHLNITNCDWLKKAYQKDKSKKVYRKPAKKDEVFYRVRPTGDVVAPTNVSYINMCVNEQGEFVLISTKEVQKNFNAFGTLMWFYTDHAPSAKLALAN